MSGPDYKGKNMRHAPFGELLSRLVGLSRLDIDEILADQTVSHRRFGEIALSFGLCSPEHVWKAWCDQLLTQVPRVDLESLGVDAQAVSMIDRDTAMRLGAIPIRQLGEVLVFAVSDADTNRIAAELGLITGKEMRFVVADANQIQGAIATYFPMEPSAA
jgi:Type II secretion system (T2SS), protein E, N-terminal domain